LSLKKEIKTIPGPAVRLALISMIICGLLFPLAVTGIAQLFLSGPANGSIAHYSNGTAVGSNLIAQNFSQPYFFHSRNVTLSASGVDPDIALQDALAQVPRISSATGIAQSDLANIVNQHIERTSLLFGDSYVNVLGLNLALIQNFRTFYCAKGYCG
jgi:potassium-transporting ATPase KdpC subunit